MESDIGITPSNDGKVIRMMVPPLTEERRRELTKTVSKLGEDGKVGRRQQAEWGRVAREKGYLGDSVAAAAVSNGGKVKGRQAGQ